MNGYTGPVELSLSDHGWVVASIPRNGMNIIARKPKDADSEFIVVDRGAGHMHRFVSATATPFSITNREWFWGHYFPTKDAAMAHFNAR